MSTSKDKIQQFMESPLVAWVSASLGEAGGREGERREEDGDMNMLSCVCVRDTRAPPIVFVLWLSVRRP